MFTGTRACSRLVSSVEVALSLTITHSDVLGYNETSGRVIAEWPRNPLEIPLWMLVRWRQSSPMQ